MDFVSIQFINIINGNQYFLKFNRKSNLKCILNFASDYEYDINRFIYCSRPLSLANEEMIADMIDKEIYFTPLEI